MDTINNQVKRELFYKLQKERNNKVKYASYIRDSEKINELYSKIAFQKAKMLNRYGDVLFYINEKLNSPIE